MLAASSGKRNVTVWRPSVRLSVVLSAYSPWLTRGQHVSVHLCPTIRRTDIIVYFIIVIVVVIVIHRSLQCKLHVYRTTKRTVFIDALFVHEVYVIQEALRLYQSVNQLWLDI